MSLPGWNVTPLGRNLPEGYSLRETEDHVYLCFQDAEGIEIVATFTIAGVRLSELDLALRVHQTERFLTVERCHQIAGNRS